MQSAPNVFLMAAGRGTRLRPWTDAVPKPVIPVANEPAMGHLLRLLARNGFRTVTSNISYLAGTMQAVFGDGSSWGVELTWSVEQDLLGTAGGMKRCEGQLRAGGEPVLVLSGDGLHEADLAALVRAHRDSGALATLGLTPVDDPSEYGVVVLDADGRITEFQEKPDPSIARSKLANTGIYVFEPEVFDRIPAGEFHDFGTQLFPKMMADGAHLAGVPLGGYWNDIGGLDELRNTNLAAAGGAVDGLALDVDDEGAWGPGVLVHPTATIAVDATLVGPCVVGADAIIGSGAMLSSALVLPGGSVEAGHAVASGTVGSIEGLARWAHSIGTET